MKKILIPALLVVCAVVSILSPWSGAALARAGQAADVNSPMSYTTHQQTPKFAFSRGGYRHAMPTWQH